MLGKYFSSCFFTQQKDKKKNYCQILIGRKSLLIIIIIVFLSFFCSFFFLCNPDQTVLLFLLMIIFQMLNRKLYKYLYKMWWSISSVFFAFLFFSFSWINDGYRFGFILFSFLFFLPFCKHVKIHKFISYCSVVYAVVYWKIVRRSDFYVQ